MMTPDTDSANGDRVMAVSKNFLATVVFVLTAGVLLASTPMSTQLTDSALTDTPQHVPGH